MSILDVLTDSQVLLTESEQGFIMELHQQLLKVNVLDDAARVAALSAATRAQGTILICARCDDATEPIIAVLEIDPSEYRWPLCGPCLSELPPCHNYA